MVAGCRAVAFDAPVPPSAVESDVGGDPEPPRIVSTALLPAPFLMAVPVTDSITGWRPNVVAEMVARTGLWAPVETQLFYALLSPPSADRARLVVDVGTNLGWFSLVALAPLRRPDVPANAVL